jgi:hypothetical protein
MYGPLFGINGPPMGKPLVRPGSEKAITRLWEVLPPRDRPRHRRRRRTARRRRRLMPGRPNSRNRLRMKETEKMTADEVDLRHVNLMDPTWHAEGAPHVLFH